MKIKSVVFDLDNTLWDCDSLIIKAEHLFYLWLEKTYPEITNLFNEASLVEHRINYTKEKPAFHHNLTYLRKEWMKDVAIETYGIELFEDYEKAYIEAGFQVFWMERNNVVFYEGAIDMLESLSKKYSLGVITNGNADIDIIGIGHYFDFSLSSEQAGVSKPDAGIFHQAMNLSNYSVEETVYIGDDPKCDVLGPQAIGMRALWYNPTLKPWPGGKVPTGVFRRHNELEDKISKL